MQWMDSKQCQVQPCFEEGCNASFAQGSRHKPHLWNLPAVCQEIWMKAMINDSREPKGTNAILGNTGVNPA